MNVFCRKCGQSPCYCKARAEHKPGCKWRTAIECPVDVECEHGRSVCPECDRCDCGAGGDYFGRFDAAGYSAMVDDQDDEETACQ